MPNFTINSFYNDTKNDNWLPLAQSECIPWIVAFITECLTIVILNFITLITFGKKSQLKRRSTCLIIHLAMVDLLVGAFSGPVFISGIGGCCGLWNWNLDRDTTLALCKLFQGFPLASLVNLTAISLERVHATFRPFKHRFTKKWAYRVLITLSWITTAAVLLAASYTTSSIWFFSSFLSLLFAICVSYIAIFIKVRSSRRPRHHCSAGAGERKLTYALFLVTLVSLLTWFPMILLLFSCIFYRQCFTRRIAFHISMIAYLLYFANSLANPLIYAMQMPELRQGIKQIIFCRTPEPSNQAVLALRHL